MRHVLFLLLCFASYQLTAQHSRIIPLPNQVSYLPGKLSVESILVKASDKVPNDLVELCKSIVPTGSGQSTSCLMKIDATAEKHAEGYILNVNEAGIELTANSERGLFYGLQSLSQLLLHESENGYLPFLSITDSPRYVYRGMHLDVARHMFPVSAIKQYIDVMAMYKFNTLHWHLTDDQGWRIEITKYPKLAEVGAYRDQTLIGNMQKSEREFDGIRYGGYYTQKEIKDVVAYAASKYITIIPEIEMPGHAEAAIAAYNHLACENNHGPFGTVQYFGVFENVFCAGKDDTFRFLQDVLDEVIELFPSKYIHIGGDECPKVKWQSCTACQKRMKKLKLKDEHELQSYFIQRIEKYLNSKGRSIIGWDEILEGGLAPNATVMSWQGIKGGIAAAQQGHDVIMTPVSHMYLDYLQSKSPEEPLAIGGYQPLSKVYSFNPTPTELTSEEAKHILGVQANIWTEYIPTPQKLFYMMLPRAMAVAEIGWTSQSQRDFEYFSNQRLPYHLAYLDENNIEFRVPTPIGATDTKLTGNHFKLHYSPSVQGSKVYYSLDGYTPTTLHRTMDEPLEITVPKGAQRTLKTVVITPRGRRSVVVTTVLKND
jgi:hexosaminidase